MKLSDRLLRYRANENITQEELATRLRVCRATINLIENDKYSASRVLRIKIDQLIGVDEDKSEG
jgi:DNA-binding XRE family transcriptional regulator